MALSVVVPVKNSDENWLAVFNDLKGLAPEDEIVVVSPSDLSQKVAALAVKMPCPCRFVHSEMGRGKQLNAGARQTSAQTLWFLHCDSRVTDGGLAALKAGLQREPRAILFFDLLFQDGSPMMRLNEVGVWFRSHVLKLPFGDQGFALHRSTFERLGGFSESAPYGEDHLFIWRAHAEGVRVVSLPSKMKTSSRKYKAHGWMKTTATHVYLTLAQAAPEAFKICRAKVSRWIS